MCGVEGIDSPDVFLGVYLWIALPRFSTSSQAVLSVSLHFFIFSIYLLRFSTDIMDGSLIPKPDGPDINISEPCQSPATASRMGIPFGY